jgi:hypothetical protein
MEARVVPSEYGAAVTAVSEPARAPSDLGAVNGGVNGGVSAIGASVRGLRGRRERART